MPAATAQVATELPRRYMTQLCKHFEHRLPVTLAEDSGHITFAAGTCALRAEAGSLVMTVEAADAEVLAQMEGVVARHLLRFAFREPPEIVWHPTA